MRYQLAFIMSVLCLTLSPACEGTEEAQEPLCGTAADVSYEPNVSLSSMNVQDAIDELAARPEPEAPLSARLYETLFTQDDDPSLGVHVLTAKCDRPSDLAVSGRCLTNTEFLASAVASVNLVSVGRGATPDEYRCVWERVSEPDPIEQLQVTAVCLRTEP